MIQTLALLLSNGNEKELTAEAPEYSSQFSFSSASSNGIIDELKVIDVNTLTPIEALSKLYELVGKAKEI